MQLRSDCRVTHIQHMGSDDAVVLAARRSTATASLEGAKGLINYLMKSRHGSPFEHGALTIEVECPIFVAREWMRHRIGWSYSELSGRYSQLADVFWIPAEDRGLVNIGKPARPVMADAPFFPDHVKIMTKIRLEAAYKAAWDHYQRILNLGVANEVARAALPVATYTNFWATCNPRSIMHFLSLRVQDDNATFPTYPMAEINQAASDLEEIFARYWPLTHEAFVAHGRVAP